MKVSEKLLMSERHNQEKNIFSQLVTNFTNVAAICWIFFYYRFQLFSRVFSPSRFTSSYATFVILFTWIALQRSRKRELHRDKRAKCAFLQFRWPSFTFILSPHTSQYSGNSEPRERCRDHLSARSQNASIWVLRRHMLEIWRQRSSFRMQR